MTLENKSTRDVIREIERVSEYRFFYNEDLQGLDQIISIKINGANIQTILNEIQRQTSIQYVIKENNQVVLSETETSSKVQQIGNSLVIKGIVVDAFGQPIIGANVMVKGTTNGTITDMDGHFALEVSSGAILQISYVGYSNFEIKVGNQKNLSITLKEDSEALDELVVVGYGTQKKATLTGAVSAISSDAILTTKNENVENMLTGKIPGVRIVQKSSEPGEFNNSFEIRGMGSPLVIVDGVPRDNMNRINPNEIESISVLKDASAAVYGVRAANGVVLITTKKGKGGKIELDYNGSIG